jgi:hypothetical protein
VVTIDGDGDSRKRTHPSLCCVRCSLTRDARLSCAQQLLFSSFILETRYRDAIYLFTGSAVYMSLLLLHLLLIRFVKNCRISSVPYTAQRSDCI